jgi:hypothetical protein
LPRRDLLDHVRRERAPDLQLLHVEAVEVEQLALRRLEERPLIALEVDRERAGQHRERLEPAGVRELDHQVGVAVGLGPRAISPCSAWRR